MYSALIKQIYLKRKFYKSFLKGYYIAINFPIQIVR